MKINFSFLIILFVAIVTFINDIILYCFHLNYIVSLVISFALVLLITLFFIKSKKLILENYFDKIDLIFLIGFFIFTVIKIVVPDYYFDVVTYHYYKQEYYFTDSINFDFLPSGGSINDFVYPLGDRMNYIFRFLLGLRLGTIVSYFAAIVIFYEVKKILKFYKKDLKVWVQVLAGICSLFIPIIYRYIGSYDIDVFSTVFLLECFYIGISKKDMFNTKKYLYYWFLISGISVGIKISNFVLIIPIGVLIIINNIKDFKNLKITDYFISILLFFLPFFIYGISNFVQAGNFFYPFLGREKFYDIEKGWNDPNWGIPNIWYSFIWPIWIAFFSRAGHDEEFLHEWIWAVGYIFLLIDIFKRCFKKEIKNDLFKQEWITLICCILWAIFMNGFCRYASIIPVLFIIAILADVEFSAERKFKLISIAKIALLILITFVSMQYRR